MSSNIFSIYLLTRLTYINYFILTLGIVLTLIFATMIISCLINIDFSYKEEDINNLKITRKKYTRKLWIPGLLFFIVTMIPDTKEALLIYAGGKTLDYVQKDSALQKIPYKATELILQKIESEIEQTESLEKQTRQ